MPRQAPAVLGITRTGPAPGQSATVYTCPDHVGATVGRLRMAGATLSVSPADRDRHLCKGCADKWAPYKRTRDL